MSKPKTPDQYMSKARDIALRAVIDMRKFSDANFANNACVIVAAFAGMLAMLDKQAAGDWFLAMGRAIKLGPLADPEDRMKPQRKLAQAKMKGVQE